MYINGVRETLTPADNSYEDCAPNSSLNLTDVGGNDKALLIGRSGDSYRVGYCKVYQARMWKRALEVLQFLKIGEMAAADWMRKFVCRI